MKFNILSITITINKRTYSIEKAYREEQVKKMIDEEREKSFRAYPII
ncbi:MULTISPECIES: YrzI family small protein [Bacillaceae]|nr:MULTISPECIES: YrzI family small protein [Bacillaceae]MDX8359490.1 YrzI family small protein [Cytobacillus sp. IB215316]